MERHGRQELKAGLWLLFVLHERLSRHMLAQLRSH
jgi:hypothetical protein